MARNVLFVCYGNVDRSPTAEEMFKGVRGFNVRSAGTSIGAKTRVSSELIRWADTIFAMDEEIRQALIKIEPSAAARIKVLGVPDNFHKNEAALRELLHRRLDSFFLKKYREYKKGHRKEASGQNLGEAVKRLR